MHYLYYVALEKEGIKTSKEAREYANTMLTNEGFCNQGGYFGGGKADWFVIGGRWSGELTKLLLDQDKLKKVNEELGDNHWWLGGEEKMTEEKRLKQYEKVFRKYFPDFKGVLPAWRNGYNQLGEEDDAMLVDEKLLKAFKKSGCKETEIFDREFGGERTIGSLDRYKNEYKYSLLGKWLVVIDYHN